MTIIVIDESLFIHGRNEDKVWVIGIINTRTHKFTLEALKQKILIL